MSAASCCIKRCRKKKEDGVTLFRFPFTRDYLKKWLENIGDLNFKPSYSDVICSDHFQPKDFLSIRGTVLLYNDAVPTIFPNMPKDESPLISTISENPRSILKKNITMDTSTLLFINHKISPRKREVQREIKTEPKTSIVYHPTIFAVQENICTNIPANMDNREVKQNRIILSNNTLHFTNRKILPKEKEVQREIKTIFAVPQILTAPKTSIVYRPTTFAAQENISTNVPVNREVKQNRIILSSNTLHFRNRKILPKEKEVQREVKNIFAVPQVLTAPKTSIVHPTILAAQKNISTNIPVNMDHHEVKKKSIIMSNNTLHFKNQEISPKKRKMLREIKTLRAKLRRREQKILSLQYSLKQLSSYKEKISSQEHFLLDDYGLESIDNKTSCELCQEKFYFVSRLVTHLKRVHGIYRPFKCTTCEKSYPRKFLLNAHVKKSHMLKIIPCTECSFMGVDTTDVERHKKRYHRILKLSCEICDENFVDKDTLITHASMHNSMQYQQCSVCNSIFKDKSSLKKHKRLYHYNYTEITDRKIEGSNENASEHKCDVCKKVYKFEYKLKQHKVKVHDNPYGDEKRTYLCAVCGKELKTSKGLQVHHRSHTGEKPFICEICGKCFSCNALLKKHNVTHTGERKYSCDQCGKSFTQRTTLVIHRRYHTGERPYKCSRCSKGFVTRTILNTHMKSCS